jgi:hypothetical protein
MQHRSTVFMLLKATAHWHALEPPAREAALDDALARVFNGFPGVRFRFWETAAFSTRCAAVMLWEAESLKDYQAAVQSLAGCDFFGRPLFEPLEVIVGAEEGWGEPAAVCAPVV